MKFDSFEWDESKRCSNIEKHNVDFEEILDLFDTFLYEIPDNRRGYGEKRTIAFGELEKQIYCPVYTRMLRPDRTLRLSIKVTTCHFSLPTFLSLLNRI